jgi:hypothetical protein
MTPASSPTGDTAAAKPGQRYRVLKLRFTMPDGPTDDAVHDMGERIITELVTDEPVTFDGTEVVDES